MKNLIVALFFVFTNVDLFGQSIAVRFPHKDVIFYNEFPGIDDKCSNFASLNKRNLRLELSLLGTEMLRFYEPGSKVLYVIDSVYSLSNNSEIIWMMIYEKNPQDCDVIDNSLDFTQVFDF